MSAAKLLDRLEGVRQSAPDRWMAKCPAHGDRSPSLSIREAEGKTLIHCFSGCSASDILAAIGLQLSDLYPATFNDKIKPARPNHWHAAREALRILHTEALVVAIGAGTLAAGGELSPEDRERLMVAAARIREAAEVAR